MQELFADFPEFPPAARVLVDGLNDMVLDYAIPDGMEGVGRGSRVEVPLRARGTTGTVLALVQPEPEGAWRLRPLNRRVRVEPVVRPALVALAVWAARY